MFKYFIIKYSGRWYAELVGDTYVCKKLPTCKFTNEDIEFIDMALKDKVFMGCQDITPISKEDVDKAHLMGDFKFLKCDTTSKDN